MVSPGLPSPMSNSQDRVRPSLPHRLRLLCVGPGEPPWALLALRLEAAGCVQAQFDWEEDAAAALKRLRKSAFDCVVIRKDRTGQEIVQFLEALRASGHDNPVVVLIGQPDDELTAGLDDLGGDVLVTTAGWQSRALVAILRRAIRRGEINREMAGLEVSARRGRRRERDEAEGHLHQLRQLVSQWGATDDWKSVAQADTPRSELIGRIESRYLELLRTYVMMGTGQLTSEVANLAEVLILAGVSTVEAMTIHLGQVEALLQGLGSRSSWHVMARADLLALELAMRLADRKRQQAGVRGMSDVGIDLMHADSLLSRSLDDATAPVR